MKIKLNHLILYIVLINFISPEFLKLSDSYKTISQISAFVRYATTFVMIGKLIFNGSFRKVCKQSFVYLSGITTVLMVLATVKNGSGYLTLGLSIVSLWGFVLFNLWYFYYNNKILLVAYKNIIFVYLLLHFCSLILQQQGRTILPFMGEKNVITTYVLLGLSAYLIVENYNHEQKRYKLLSILIFIIFVMSLNNSSTAMLIVLLLGMYMIAYNTMKSIGKKNRRKIVRIVMIIGGFVALSCVMSIVLDENSMIIESVTQFLGKDSTFSGRSAIWKQAIVYIVENPLWGLGQNIIYDVWYNSVVVYSAHNAILDCAVKYGCIAMIGFILMIITSLLQVIKSNIYNLKYILLPILILTIVAMMTEAIEGMYTTWILLQLSCLYSGKITEKENENIRLY